MIIKHLQGIFGVLIFVIAGVSASTAADTVYSCDPTSLFYEQQSCLECGIACLTCKKGSLYYNPEQCPGHTPLQASGGTRDLLRIYVPWNPIQHPETFGDVLMACANNPACTPVLDAAGAYLGLSPGTVTASLLKLNAIGGQIAGQGQREEFRTNVFAPSGYRVCDVEISMISAAPMHQNRSPTFAATIQSDRHFELYSFVHQQQLSRGNSWVDAVAQVHFVRIGSSLEANCYAKPGGIYQYRCNQQNYQGMPICGNVSFRGLPRIR